MESSEGKAESLEILSLPPSPTVLDNFFFLVVGSLFLQLFFLKSCHLCSESQMNNLQCWFLVEVPFLFFGRLYYFVLTCSITRIKRSMFLAILKCVTSALGDLFLNIYGPVLHTLTACLLVFHTHVKLLCNHSAVSGALRESESFLQTTLRQCKSVCR